MSWQGVCGSRRGGSAGEPVPASSCAGRQLGLCFAGSACGLYALPSLSLATGGASRDFSWRRVLGSVAGRLGPGGPSPGSREHLCGLRLGPPQGRAGVGLKEQNDSGHPFGAQMWGGSPLMTGDSPRLLCSWSPCSKAPALGRAAWQGCGLLSGAPRLPNSSVWVCRGPARWACPLQGLRTGSRVCFLHRWHKKDALGEAGAPGSSLSQAHPPLAALISLALSGCCSRHLSLCSRAGSDAGAGSCGWVGGCVRMLSMQGRCSGGGPVSIPPASSQGGI